MAEKGAEERGATPHCVSIVICDNVIEDKATNNKTLVGLFNQILAHALPTKYHRLFVVASLTDGRGKCPIALRISHLSSSREIARVDGEVDFKDPLEVLDLVVELRGLPFFEEGTYVADVVSANTILGQRRFAVILPKEQSS